MAKDVENHVSQCDICLHFKQKLQKAKLNQIEATHPMELVYIDYFTTESRKSNKYVNNFIVRDHFTRYAQAFTTPSQTTEVTTQDLWKKYFVYYGFPETIISDQG